MKKLFMLCFVLTCVSPSLSFCEEDPGITAYRPTSASQSQAPQDNKTFKAVRKQPAPPADPTSEEDRLKREIKTYKKYLNHLMPYVAIRNENPDICTDETDRNEVANTLLDYRYMGEGKCDKIRDPIRKNVCFALKNKNKSALNRLELDYYDALESENFDALVKAIQAIKAFAGEKIESTQRTKNYAYHDLAIYFGYKHYSSLNACQTYMSRIDFKDRAFPLSNRLACGLLFDPKADEALNQAMRDVGYFVLARKEKNTKLCAKIQNGDIKNACLDLSYKNIDDIFGSAK